MKKIGFIGLGVMGRPMAANLIRAGYPLKVYNRSSGPVDALVTIGAQRGIDAKDTAAFADVIITMLPDSPDVKSVVMGKGGVLEGARPGAVLIDMSSIAPLVSQEVARAANQKDVKMLDAPVSGGEPKAVDGTLAIMVGGPEDVFEQVEPILSVMGASVTRGGGHRRRKHRQTGQPGHRGLKYRRHGRGHGAGDKGRRSTGKRI